MIRSSRHHIFALLFFISGIGGVFFLSACGGGGGGGESSSSSNSISGIVDDDPVPDADVTLTLDDGSILATTTTNSSGEYSITLTEADYRNVRLYGPITVSATSNGKTLRGLISNYGGGAYSGEDAKISHNSEAIFQVADATGTDVKELYPDFLKNYKDADYIPSDPTSDPVSIIAGEIQTAFTDSSITSITINETIIRDSIDNNKSTEADPSPIAQMLYSKETCNSVCKEMKNVTIPNVTSPTTKEKLVYSIYVNEVRPILKDDKDSSIQALLETQDSSITTQKVYDHISSVLSVIGLGTSVYEVAVKGGHKFWGMVIARLGMYELLLDEQPTSLSIPFKKAAASIISKYIEASLKAGTVIDLAKFTKAPAPILDQIGIIVDIAQIHDALFWINKLRDGQISVRRSELKLFILDSYFSADLGRMENSYIANLNDIKTSGDVTAELLPYGSSNSGYRLFRRAERAFKNDDAYRAWMDGIKDDHDNSCTSFQKIINFAILDGAECWKSPFDLMKIGVSEEIKALVMFILDTVEFKESLLNNEQDVSQTIYAEITNPAWNKVINIGDTVSFSGKGAGSSPLTYLWAINNGSNAELKSDLETFNNITFDSGGVFSSKFTVTDGNDVSVTAEIFVSVNSPPSIKTPTNSDVYHTEGMDLGFTVVVTDAEDITIPNNSIEWTLLKDGSSISEIKTYLGSEINIASMEKGDYLLNLVVTDSNELSAEITKKIYVTENLDDDGDGVPDDLDVFPQDSLESEDTDSDGTGNNADLDDDGDGVLDVDDKFPKDKNESGDADGDGIGDKADSDDDNDGNIDSDVDGDGIGDKADSDDDNDGTPDSADACPTDPKGKTDTDLDGICDYADSEVTDCSGFDYTGTWQATYKATSSDPECNETRTVDVDVTQTGCSITASIPSMFSESGTAGSDGKGTIKISATYDEGAGQTSESGTINIDGNSVTGSSTWTWAGIIQGQAYSCSGTSAINGTKR